MRSAGNIKPLNQGRPSATNCLNGTAACRRPRMRQGLAGTCRVLTPRLQLKRLTILSARRDLSQADRMTEHGKQAAMPKKKRHSRVEIATKLAQANDLATQGKLQREIARSLGVSIMTLHRWRKEASQPDRAPSGGTRLAELQLENSRLRRLVTDLLLEKTKLEEAAQRQKVSA